MVHKLVDQTIHIHQPLKMINISGKSSIRRMAKAEGKIWLQQETIEKIRLGKIKKGTVLSAANTAAIIAVKRTPELIPLCHQIPLSEVSINFQLDKKTVTAKCEVSGTSRTGMEIEALVGVSTALITIWDMVKYLEKDEQGQYPKTMITDVKILTKIKEQ